MTVKIYPTKFYSIINFYRKQVIRFDYHWPPQLPEWYEVLKVWIYVKQGPEWRLIYVPCTIKLPNLEPNIFLQARYLIDIIYLFVKWHTFKRKQNRHSSIITFIQCKVVLEKKYQFTEAHVNRNRNFCFNTFLPKVCIPHNKCMNLIKICSKTIYHLVQFIQ